MASAGCFLLSLLAARFRCRSISRRLSRLATCSPLARRPPLSSARKIARRRTDAAALANGAAVVNGATVSQFVGGAGVPGVLYALVVTAPTALGESLVRYGNFKFEAVG